MCGVFTTVLYINNPLTWNGGSLIVAANLHPCWPRAQSQLPHFCLLPSSHCPSFSLLPTNLCNCYNTDGINMPESSSLGHVKASKAH
jgi:hypothetical protein